MTVRTAAHALRKRLMAHLHFIYPNADATQLAEDLMQALDLDRTIAMPQQRHNNWTEANVLAITYGDTLISAGEKPLTTLTRFFAERLTGVLSGVHVLPFYPYSSDDGFAVVDYLEVNPQLGDWSDIFSLAGRFRLMADLVINHASSKSQWFENFKKGADPGKDYFVTASPDDDLSQVVRPRSSPLLQEVQTSEGEKHVWCTFSSDQVDLNFKNPQVLIEFVKIIRHYMDNGVKIFRLDAVAFLWKEPGSRCLHLQQTHEIIKLLRALIEHRDPRAMIITETNVPNRENLTYFGNANEAHAIYNFSLPPLLVHALVTGEARHLQTWMMSMPPAQLGTTFLNFIASHDGIGLRPTEGLLSEHEISSFIETMKSFGGLVTTRRLADGDGKPVDKPYEINISLFDALKGTVENGPDELQADRFLAAHTIMLALEGIPAIYIHSFLGTENDCEKVERTGQNRSINRKQWDYDQINRLLDKPASHHHQVFQCMCRRVRIRRRQPAFHPNATQYTLHLGEGIFAFWRQSINRDQSIFAINNVTAEAQDVRLEEVNLIGTDQWVDLISGERVQDHSGKITLAPYQSLWLSNRF